MYLKRLTLLSTGPIEHADIECRFGEDGSPMPLILVGQNGSGKSVAIAHVVSALIDAHGTVFVDSDVENGKVYKLRSSTYIRHGSDYSTAEVHLSDGFSVYEAQMVKIKSDFVDPYPLYSRWNEIPPDDNTHYASNFLQGRDRLKKCMNHSTHLFFPPNRFEDPAWLNEYNLLNKANYSSLRNYSGVSNRPIVNYSPMRDLQNWLLDLVYDSYALERVRVYTPVLPGFGQTDSPNFFEIRNGPATSILKPIEEFLRILFGREGVVIWSVGARNRRNIGLRIGDQFVTDNLFQLSTGQAILLDLFLTIIRDFDLSHAQLNQLSDIEGMVIIDEIDLHLHSDLQHDLLPKLIQGFSKIQFIITTHSPLFLIGMDKIFKSEGFQLIELPAGQEIEVERFSEFEAAYKYMRESSRFQEDVRVKIEASQSPIIYLEGATDISYLIRAGQLLGKSEIIDKFELLDAVGYQQLNKIWDLYKTNIGSYLKKKIVLLYDCDAGKTEDNIGYMFRRTIKQKDHKIFSGIENLFPDITIQRSIAYKPAFVDITKEHVVVERGYEKKVPESWKINKDEKRNLCDWLCENGTIDDFRCFLSVFDMLCDVLLADVN